MTDIYIQVLQFARDNPGFSPEDLNEKFPDDFKWLNKEIGHGNLFQSVRIDGNVKYYLSFEDRFRLLENEELNDARSSSKKAMCIAIISIGLTLCGLVYQLFTISKVEVVNMEDMLTQKTEIKQQAK